MGLKVQCMRVMYTHLVEHYTSNLKVKGSNPLSLSGWQGWETEATGARASSSWGFGRVHREWLCLHEGQRGGNERHQRYAHTLYLYTCQVARVFGGWCSKVGRYRGLSNLIKIIGIINGRLLYSWISFITVDFLYPFDRPLTRTIEPVLCEVSTSRFHSSSSP